jgi:hypothetical protein
MLPNGRRTWWAIGTEPANNLNWGGGTGIRAMLLKTPGWRLVAEESGGKLPLQRTIFARTITPDAFWKGLGVDRPFDATIVLLALDYRDIDEGFKIFADLVRGRDDVGKVSLPGGREVDLGRSRIVGMAVHYVPEGPEIVGPGLSADEPKAVFLASCFSATAFGPLLVRKKLFPVFLSIPTTSSEGYIYLPVIEGLFRGSDMHRILTAVDASYYSWHKRHTGETQYTNPSCKGFEKVLSDASDDWDGDDLPNDVDPEPLVPNRRALEPDTGRMRIDLSDGRVIRVDSQDVVR